jgi:hypothetical protein
LTLGTIHGLAYVVPPFFAEKEEKEEKENLFVCPKSKRESEGGFEEWGGGDL